jgi:ribosomal protein S18 acetylase RimI-like enzyme
LAPPTEIADADVEAVVDLWRRCGLTRPWNDPFDDIAQARRTADSTVLVVREGHRLVATVMVGFDGHRGWIYYLAVDPDAQGGGRGRAMMAAAEAWLKARGAPKLQLMVREDNVQALGFYDRLGLERQAVVTLGKRLDIKE